MAEQVTFDLVTFDPANDEYVLYLLEDGPWPDTEDGWRDRLLAIQTRVLLGVDAATKGPLADLYADSRGKGARIQIDSPGGSPEHLEDLVDALNQYIHEDPHYGALVRGNPFVRGVRVVTGKEMGRFADDAAAS